MRGKEKDRKRERVRETKKEKGGEERDRTSEKRRVRKKERGRGRGDRKNDRKATQESGQRVSATLRDCEFLARSNGEVLHLIMTSHNRDNASLCGRYFPRNCERGNSRSRSVRWYVWEGGVSFTVAALYAFDLRSPFMGL